MRRIREPLRAAVGASVSVAERGAPPHYTVKRTQQAPRARRGPCRGRAARATARERVCRHAPTLHAAHGTRPLSPVPARCFMFKFMLSYVIDIVNVVSTHSAQERARAHDFQSSQVKSS